MNDLKQFEAEQALLAAIVNSSEDAIVSKDLQGIVTSWNQAAERIYGWKAEEIIGKSKALVIPPELPNELAFILKKVQAGERIEHYETRRLRKDGRRIDVAISVSPINTSREQIIGAATIVRDITEHRHAQEQWMQHQAYIAVLQERNRMAQELHDTLAQGFVGIAMQLEVAKDLLRSEPEQAEYHFSRAAALARESLAEARRSVQALRPTLLQNNTLAKALTLLVEQVTEGTPVVGEFVGKGKVRLLLPSVEDGLLRVAQEALTNALRHGKATRLQVELTFTANAVQLGIQDNGQGFDTRAPVPSGHHGLMGMHERAERLGGTLTIRSERGQGTEVLIVVPTHAAEQAD
ncbi:MAG: hypothetical protein JWN14_1117 [Chthonomonadales bacterium]|nr:hypothetical protein [Chthonomonadales bacterium]